jgi:hypothetical protein
MADEHEQAVPDEQVAEDRAIQDDEVLQREGLEQELMQEGRSHVGEDVPDADDQE